MVRRKGRKSSQGRRQRPVGVTIWAVLEVIAALFMFIGAAFFSIIGGLSIVSLLLGATFRFGAAVLFILGLVALVTAYGFIEGTNWGWWLGLVVAGLAILSVAFADIVGFVIGLMLVYYLTRPNVKKWFRV